MENRESPFEYVVHGTHSVFKLFPLINDGQWGNVSEVGTEVISKLETLTDPRVVVDLSHLEYMGSAQVALLVRIWKSLKKKNGKLVVLCPHPMVQEVLSLAGLKSLWQIVSTEAEAFIALGVPQPNASRKGTAGWWLLAPGFVAAGAALGLQLQPVPQLAPLVQPALAGAGALLCVGGGGWLIARGSNAARTVAAVLMLAGLGLSGTAFARWQSAPGPVALAKKPPAETDQLVPTPPPEPEHPGESDSTAASKPSTESTPAADADKSPAGT